MVYISINFGPSLRKDLDAARKIVDDLLSDYRERIPRGPRWSESYDYSFGVDNYETADVILDSLNGLHGMTAKKIF